jgi:pimeloyl-ACP methyl ester carboxylesterase
MRMRPARGDTLHVEVLRQRGPTVVFLPGAGGTTRYRASRVASLAVTSRLVVIDRLGFGPSPKPWTTYSIERHVTELHRVLADRGPVTPIGDAVSVIAAFACAARYIQQIDALVLLNLPNFAADMMVT